MIDKMQLSAEQMAYGTDIEDWHNDRRSYVFERYMIHIQKTHLEVLESYCDC